MKENQIALADKQFIAELGQIVHKARQFAYSAVNYAQIRQNWLIGQKIVEQEQKGKARAEYGKQVIKLASESLTAEFGKGFSERNLWKFKQFFLMFPNLPIMPTLSAETNNEKLPTLSAELLRLSWSHYERLMRVTNEEERQWYMKEASEQMWSYRTLDRNISTLYYRRVLSSQIKEPVREEMKEKTALFQNDRMEFIKNPSVLEFLGLPSNTGYTETVLEQAIINHLQEFIMELGRGFAFVARQQMIRTDTQDYFIDLVFYNVVLKCYVLIDLKVGAITHQDVGQMDMYIRMYDDLKRTEGDNPTIGIVLCSETSKAIAKYSILNGSKQLFATKYMPYLPTEEELRREIEQQKELFLLQQNDKNANL